MKSFTKNAAKSARDIAYYRRRYENCCFEKLVAWIAEECQKQQITKKDLAERMGKDPGQVSRLLSAPSNLTLNTISDLLLAFDAEAEPPEIVLFKDRSAPNYIHPLIARVTQTKVAVHKLEAFPNSPSQPIAGANSNEWRVVVGAS